MAVSSSGKRSSPRCSPHQTARRPGPRSGPGGRRQGPQRLDGRHSGRRRLGAGGPQWPRSAPGRGLLLVNGEVRIKRVQRVTGGAWLLISDNPRYEKELIKLQDMKDVEILGRCEIRIGRIS
ncbi:MULTISPECIES: S24 family peptidase [unclassified Halomonas]|uniref:S24 family peptidase n=1 Tax=unclassified Halomonas TaxID=2609666 RepID=UPI0028F441B4|nr:MULTISPECIES: S24 family peptidase [unclassified Halomonas]